MTVHMVRIFSHFPDGYTVDQINDRVQNWVDNHTEWSEDPISHAVVERQAGWPVDPGTVYLTGDFRFMPEDDKTALLDDAEAALQGNVSWYRLGYHVCDHDEDGQGGCSWGTTREYGDIPTDIPEIL